MRGLRVERGCRNPDPGDLMSSLGLTFLTPGIMHAREALTET